MSGFVDFVVASPHEAEALANADTVSDQWPSTSAKFIFQYHLLDLLGILANTEPEDDFPELTSTDRWNVYSLPESLVNLLSAVKQEDIPDIAQQWYKLWDMPLLQDETSLSKLITTLVELTHKIQPGQSILVRESQG